VVDRRALGGDLLNPRSIVADEFARRLDASGQFQEILTMPVDGVTSKPSGSEA
jgi:hypothetical protein